MSQVVVEKPEEGRAPRSRKPEDSVGPLALSEIGQSRLQALNAFYRRRRPVTLTVAGEQHALTAAWDGGAEAVARASISISIDETQGRLSLPLSIVEGWIAKVDPDANVKQLAPQHRALLIECALSDDLNRLEVQLGCTMTLDVVEIGSVAPANGDFKLRLSRGRTVVDCALSIEDRWAVRLGEALDGPQKNAPALHLDLPVAVAIWRGASIVSLADLRSLQPGDVIVPEDMNQAQEAAVAIVADRFVAPVQSDAEGWHLTGGLRPAKATKWEWIMDQSKQPPAAEFEDTDLEDLPLTVVFEVGRVRMSVKEISQLSPGAVVRITDPADHTVDLLANGKRIGRGEMVSIGDGMGVQIARIFGDA